MSDWTLAIQKLELEPDFWRSSQAVEYRSDSDTTMLDIQAIETRFPKIGSLLKESRKTHVTCGHDRYLLHVWATHDGDTCGWLCAPPMQPKCDIRDESILCLALAFGGIVRSWTNRDEFNWVSGNRWTLCPSRYFMAVDDQEYLIRICGDCGIDYRLCPDLSNYAVVADRGTGEDVLSHRIGGDMLLFAPAGGVDDICLQSAAFPDFTAYSMKDAHNFVEWVEMIAGMWSSQMSRQ